MGTSIEPFSLPDQFDAIHSVDPQTRLILFSRDKDVAKMACAVLNQKGSSYFADRKAVMLLDIMLTVVSLKDLAVHDVAYVSDAAALEKALAGLER